MTNQPSFFRHFFLNLRMPYMDLATKFLCCLFLFMEMAFLGAAIWPTAWLILTFSPKISSPAAWTLLILAAVLVFNYAYLIAILIIRIIIPRPREGYFPRRENGRPPAEGLILMLNLFLVMARYLTPWAALFSSVLVNLFPLHFFYRRFFGPDTPTITLGDLYRCLDPYLVEAGRNVQFGFACTILGHIFDDNGLLIQKVKIGDYAVVGGESTIMPGVEVGHHAVIGSRSLVLSGTRIKPYELWAGTPARKIKDLTPGNRVQE
ncbi:MAG: acyltransferase [Desulfatirhabdiaceae bacterium]|nr:acyltransferase [Desulfatirhabdiaceae bacterium]